MQKDDSLHLCLRLLHDKKQELKTHEEKCEKLREEAGALELLVDLLGTHRREKQTEKSDGTS